MMDEQKKLLENFLQLSNKIISPLKKSSEKEKLQKEYIDLFFNDSFENIKQKEINWQEENNIIGTYNQIFLDINNIEDILVQDIQYEILKQEESLIKLKFEPQIEIKNTEFVNFLELKDNIVKLKKIKYLKKDTDREKQLKDDFNQVFEEIISTQNISKILEMANGFNATCSVNKNGTMITIAIELNENIIKAEYKPFGKIKKNILELKKQKNKANPFLNNEKYYLMKIQEFASKSPFLKYKLYKEINTCFKNSIAPKDEKITYTPDDLADFSSKLLYTLLERIGYFDNRKIVFADLFCGSGNLAMSFIKELENNDKSRLLKWIYLNDKIENREIGNILKEYLSPIWNKVPEYPISNIEITENNFIALSEEGDEFGFGTVSIKPNIIMSNPDFDKKFIGHQKKIQDNADKDAIFLYFFNKELEDIEGFTKIVIKLDSQNLFLNTSSILYLNFYLPESIVKKHTIKTSFINIPDVDKYFSRHNSSIWKDKKKDIDFSLIDIIIELIFDYELNEYSFTSFNNYFILDEKILLDEKENNKKLLIKDEYIFLDKEEEVYFKTNLPSKYATIKDDMIYYISSSDDINYFKIPLSNGVIDNILSKKYEDLKNSL
jgi:hypothetical protein